MTVTNLNWIDAMNSVRGSRVNANPNFGFQRQLQNYENTTLKKTKEDLIQKYGPLNPEDELFALENLRIYTEKQKPSIKSDDRVERFKHEKIYPLAFNAYGLDEEKKLTKPNSIQIQSEEINKTECIDS